MTDQATSTPHDAIFKHVLGHVETARDFLEIHLPPALLTLCDLNTLKLEPGSLVEKSLRSRYSDILYSVHTLTGEGYIYALIEHQSRPEKHMAFRLMRYALDAMQRHLNAKNSTLPLVIPILFYHGQTSPYPYTLRWLDEFDDPQLAYRLYSQPFPLVDITVIPDSEIMQHRRMASLELLQKHIRLRDLSTLIAPLAGLLAMEYTDPEQLVAILNYMLHNGKTEAPEKLIQELTQYTLHNEGTIMTVAEYLESKGLEKGLIQGLEKGLETGRNEEALRIALAMLKNGIDPALVKEVTGVADDVLEQSAAH